MGYRLVRPAAVPARVRWTLAGLAGLAMTIGAGFLVRGDAPALDVWLHAWAVHHRAGEVVSVARVLTQGGSTLVIWPMLILAAIVFPRSTGRRRWLTSLGVLALAGSGIGIRLLVSLLVRRDRPPSADWAGPAGGFAYPSGHTATAAIGVGMLSWALTRHLTRRAARAWVWTGAAGYALVVGWTRIWLGVHWPTDVLGGWLMVGGWLCTVVGVLGPLVGAVDVRPEVPPEAPPDMPSDGGG